MNENSGSEQQTAASSLSPEKAKLIELLFEKHRAQHIQRRPRPQQDGPVRLPVSWAQQRLWFFEQVTGEGWVYNVPIALTLRGPLKSDALRHALDALVRRHEVLRTVFVNVQGQPQQQIAPHATFALRVWDLSACAEPGRSAHVLAHRAEEAQAPFDLQAGPLIRGSLLRIDEQLHLLLITMHHIVSDGWSIRVLLRELGTLYEGYCAGTGDTLPPLPVQYADYAQWQRRWLSGAVLEKQARYWQVRLQDAPPHSELPTDRARPAVQSFRGGSVPVVIHAELTAHLKTLAQRHEMTLFMLLYATWAVLLARLSGQSDVVIGTPVANRGRSELEGLIGFFVNMLVLRVDVNDDSSVAEFLAQVRTTTLDAYDHQDMPFERLVEILKPERSLSRHPIFQTSFMLDSDAVQAASLSGLDVTVEDSAKGVAKFDLLLNLQNSDQQLCGTLDYAADLFDESTIRRWSACLIELLSAIARSDSGTTVGELSILPQSEWRQVIQSFNLTATPYSSEKLIHQLFEDRVLARPDAPALRHGDQTVSYADLNARANRLAHFLRAHGIGPDQLVGVCMERSIDLIVAFLGVLKAGGAYVPLDPSYPPERLDCMLQDSAPSILLIEERVRARLPRTSACVVALDSDRDRIESCPDSDLDSNSVGVLPRHLANVIYTSGSTGRPKGVMVEHRSVLRLVVNSTFAPIHERHRLGHCSSPSFDAATWEIWASLLGGACLVIVPHEVVLNPRALKRLLLQEGVNALWLTVGLFNEYVDALEEVFARLDYLIIGGDALNPGIVARALSKAQPPRRLINGYGPTETTTFATTYPIPSDFAPDAPIPIGAPISNTSVYILDKRRRPVPIGTIGEIWIGGPGVARGYLNQPAATAERFVPDPFTGASDARLYRSGDLGRWREDGLIEYVGRNDTQVKIRGFRVEPGEIETQLARHAQVREAAVITREDEPGAKRLVAYVVTRTEGAASVEELRAHLKEVLPEFMVPSAFVMLACLPVTPNGKLDRRALPAPEQSAYAQHAYEAPLGQVEEVLAGIWQSLLRVERVGRHDNFFELGGHSLLIMQLMERLRRVGLSVEVRDVFAHPTLQELGQVIVSAVAPNFEVPPNLIPEQATTITPEMLTLVELQPRQIERIAQTVPGGAANIKDIYPLAPLQEGILFHHLLNDHAGDTYVLPLAFEVQSRPRLEEFIAALQRAIDRHDVLRSAVLWDELPMPVQVVYRRATLPVTEVTLDARDVNEQIEDWLRPERQRIDIRQAPLLRLQVAHDIGAERWYALLQLHHMTIDHVALQIVVSEVVADLEGRPQRFAESAPYRNHVAQVLAYARKHDSDGFFRGKLADVTEPTAAFGLLDVHGDGTRIEESRETLAPGLARAIRKQARQLGVSTATLFHAAWALVVARASGRDDIVFGSVLLGRLQGSAGAQRTLGMFINTLPLRLRLEPLTARQLVEQTQRELVELLSHEQASLSAAQRCSGIVGTAPLFTTLFNYRHSVPNTDLNWFSADGIRTLVGQERTNYPITLSLDDMGEDFVALAQTDRRIDPRRVIGYLRTAMQSLLHALEQAPEAAATSLEVLSSAELADVLHSFNGSYEEYPRGKSIHAMFEAQVACAPNAVALMHGTQTLSYVELNRCADRLAHFLRTQGVQPDRLVGICLERGFDMIVAVLATLKAGGAYLPLDPSYPPQRLSYMLDDARAEVVITQERLLPVLGRSPGGAITMEALRTHIAQEVAEGLRTTAEQSLANHLVYVIYTSGSTGRPKGTAMPHGAMANLIEWHRATFGAATGTRVLQFAALSFDVAFQEIFSTLCTGGTLVLLDEWVRRDAGALVELLREQRVERLFVPPLMLQSLAEYLVGTRVPIPPLRDVITAGEQLRISPEIVEVFARAKDCRLHNHYGPTETHVVTALTLAEDSRQWPTLPTIGRPIANTQIRILDSRGRPVPVGASGEIFIAGANVARGYLNRPELTAERFLPDPFGADRDARMYKSGDLGRWCPDGTIEYLGRNDDQVKLRGFRIELGEIEAQLLRMAQLREAAVILREDVPGQKRLVAYVVPYEGAAPTPEQMRRHLKALVPEHSVPTVFITIEQLPRTPSGKLDRRALPTPELGGDGESYEEPPRSPTEQQIAAIWREVLGVERISRSGNFFDLGGHSLLALKALLRINQSFGCQLRVTDMYRSPTVADLAACVSGVTDDDRYVELRREAVLEPDIVAASGGGAVGAGAVLLTGAAGFVGRFLLRQLLEDTDARIYCLLRDPTPQQAGTRLRATLGKWDLWRDEYAGRVVAVCGDLRQPRIGMDSATYRTLSAEVDSIYHCATSMNHLETYAMARAANVAGSKEVLRLAVQTRPKLVNYVSTLGIFSSSALDTPRTVTERTPIEGERHLHSQGYLASKWVADQLFLTAAQRGIPCNILRLGLVWADAELGRFDELQSVYRILKTCLLSGYGIAGYRYPLAPTPVDYVARAILCLAGRHPRGGGVFHISASEQTVGSIFERCNDLSHVTLQLVPYYQWIGIIKHLHQQGCSLPAVPVIEAAFALDEDAFTIQQRSTRSAAHVTFDCSVTQRELERAGIATPVMDDALLAVCVRDMLARDPDFLSATRRLPTDVDLDGGARRRSATGHY